MTYQNTIRDSIERDNLVFGASSTSVSPKLAEVYAIMGLDFTWFDYEHQGPGSHGPAFEDLARTAASANIDPMVRIQSNDPPLVRKVLDAGIRTIVIPRVKTAADLRQAVEAAYFNYDGDVGDRGAGLCLTSGWGADRPKHYTEREDSTILVGAMLETEEAYHNIDEIMSVPELGFCWLGPADLSVSMGYPFETEHDEVQTALDTFIDKGQEYDVPIGASVGYDESIADAVDDGLSIVNLGNELTAVRRVVGDRLDTANELN